MKKKIEKMLDIKNFIGYGKEGAEDFEHLIFMLKSNIIFKRREASSIKYSIHFENMNRFQLFFFFFSKGERFCTCDYLKRKSVLCVKASSFLFLLLLLPSSKRETSQSKHKQFSLVWNCHKTFFFFFFLFLSQIYWF